MDKPIDTALPLSVMLCYELGAGFWLITFELHCILKQASRYEEVLDCHWGGISGDCSGECLVLKYYRSDRDPTIPLQ